MQDMIASSGIGTGNLPCLHTLDNGPRETQTWKADDKHVLSSDPCNKNIHVCQGYFLNKNNHSSNVPVVKVPCIEENSHLIILEENTRVKHTELKSLKAGLLRGKNAGSKLNICSVERKSTRIYRSISEWAHLQPQILTVTDTDEPCPTFRNWMLYKNNNTCKTSLTDKPISENSIDLELDDASNEFFKEDERSSYSIDPPDVQLLNTPLKLSSLIKIEMKLKIQCRRVQEGLPEMPHMHDNLRHPIELSDEEKQHQQLRLNRARQASKTYRRKFKSRETELKEVHYVYFKYQTN
ncbi:hypothetical protein DPMN_031078 [Dreissena polymorpha]|uniref:Uncharacterized protein n=1 Tax=Dreissena polymorpha TaxID=45954 RepID=A0A9D4RHP7_DREPO|nr:hypothetical protein DPMN_031078 [Dreissena polymorpha]